MMGFSPFAAYSVVGLLFDEGKFEFAYLYAKISQFLSQQHHAQVSSVVFFFSPIRFLRPLLGYPLENAIFILSTESRSVAVAWISIAPQLHVFFPNPWRHIPQSDWVLWELPFAAYYVGELFLEGK